MKGLNRDLLVEIMARVDGTTLAATACACSDLRGVVQDEGLWEDLCHSTWPSTIMKEAQHLISSSSSSIGGFAKFYADCFPLIVYKEPHKLSKAPELRTHVSPSDFVSMVDVYYNGNCIFSRVLHGIPAPGDHGLFLNSPFKLDLLDYQSHRSIHDDDDDDDGDNDDDMGTLPSIPLDEKKGRCGGKFCLKLEENVRLSWVVLNKKKGKAVNLSSLKPLLIQRNWPSKEDYLMRFGCIIPVDEQVLSCKSAECVISLRCRLMEKEGCMRLREISMRVEDREGAHVSGSSSLMVLDCALDCWRSNHGDEVEKGYMEYEKQKRDMREKKVRKESIVDGLCVSIGIVVTSIFFLMLTHVDHMGM